MAHTDKYNIKKTIRMNAHTRSVIEKTHREIRSRTGLMLSYGKISRLFWDELAKNKSIRNKCMALVCKAALEQYNNKNKAAKNVRKKH